MVFCIFCKINCFQTARSKNKKLFLQKYSPIGRDIPNSVVEPIFTKKPCMVNMMKVIPLVHVALQNYVDNYVLVFLLPVNMTEL